MRTHKTILTLSLIASLALLAGCDKGNQTTVNDAAKSVTDKANAAGAEIGKAVEAAKPVVEKTITALTNNAAGIPAAANDQAASIIDQAKALVGQNKYTEALSSLQQLTGMKLSDSQTTMVAALKEQIQKAMAAKTTTDAAGSVGNLLQK
jgi:hypothetical protein